MKVSPKGQRIRGRRGVALRKARLQAEPLCRLCKAGGKITVATVPDHIRPLALGGTDTDENIRCLCAEHHDQVTREQFGLKEAKKQIGLDGWPT
jgi:5-methylcytosine-specific restriction enzyme A